MPEHQRKNPGPFYARMGRMLREARKAAGMEQRDVAAVLGVTAAEIGQYESGVRRIPAERIVPLCTAVRCTPNWILGWPTAGERPEATAMRKAAAR
jgi:transcriptional regulator with XRE-family HTH domain